MAAPARAQRADVIHQVDEPAERVTCHQAIGVEDDHVIVKRPPNPWQNAVMLPLLWPEL